MNSLEDFRAKDFFEQAQIIQAIEESCDFNAIASLYNYLDRPLGDAAIDTLIRNCLRALLLKNESKTLEGLSSGNLTARMFCVGIAGEIKLAAAAPFLSSLAARETDPDRLLNLLTAMERIGASDFLPVFQKGLRHPDTLIAGLCIQMVGRYRDQASLPPLCAQISDNELDDRYETCEITTWKAIEALAAIGSPEALDFLVSKVHHKNPTARRIVHEALIKIGAAAVAPLGAVLTKDDTDGKIMAANVLGMIGDKKGGDHLVHALDDGFLNSLNLKFAAYEALGRIPSMKSLVCLLDALVQEEDEALLIAVVTALDRQVNPGMAAKVAALLKEGPASQDGKSEKILAALVSAKALTLFEALYEDIELSERIIERVERSNDSETIDSFWVKLQGMGGERAASQAVRLTSCLGSEKHARLLAIDDSVAMLNFYRSAASELGFEVSTAENGQIALDILGQGLSFDCIIVDMNMPVMDGIEFTTRLRSQPEYHNTPVIMATTESAKSQAGLAKKAGVTSFLKKPFTLDILQTKIRKILE